MFINQVSESNLDDDSGSSNKGDQHQKIANPNIRATNMDIIHEEMNEESRSSSYRKAQFKNESF